MPDCKVFGWRRCSLVGVNNCSPFAGAFNSSHHFLFKQEIVHRQASGCGLAGNVQLLLKLFQLLGIQDTLLRLRFSIGFFIIVSHI